METTLAPMSGFARCALKVLNEEGGAMTLKQFDKMHGPAAQQIREDLRERGLVVVDAERITASPQS